MQGYEFVHDECNSKEMARKILKVYEKTIKLYSKESEVVWNKRIIVSFNFYSLTLDQK